jgi:hypothetical protein
MIEPPPSAPDPELFPDDVWPEDDPPERPGLRRLLKAIYILVVVLVIAGLIIMFFPWDRVDLPFDPPFRSPGRA